MKKHLLLLFIMGLMIPALAQTPGMMQRKMLPGKIDTLIINYFSYSKFSSLDDIGFSDAVANQFKSLFNSGANLTDEANPSFYDKDFEHPFNLPTRSIDDYLAKTKENYPAGLFVKYNAIQVDYTALTILLLKETNGTTKDGLLYKVTDTLKLKLTASADFKNIKIQDATVLGYTITLANDDDRDFIANELDKCPKEQGFRSATGCFTKEEKAAYVIAEKERKRKEKEDNSVVKNDKDKLALAKAEKDRLQKEKDSKDAMAKNDKNNTDKDAAAMAEKARLQKEKEEKEALVLQEKEEKERERNRVKEPSLPGLFIGLTVSGGNNNINAPFDVNNIGYLNLRTGNKSSNHITGLNPNKKAPFTQLQLDLEYYFGAKKKIGIATGIGYTGFNASFAMDSAHLEYQATDSKNNIYRRVLTVHAIDEELMIRSLNIPILLQFKFGLGDKANMTLGLGANYHSVLSTKASGTASADYEAIYSFQNGQSIFDTASPPSRSSWLITRSNVEAHNGKIGEAEYFTQKRADGYDVAIDQSLKKEETLNLIGSMGALLRLNANFKLSEKIWLATLLQFQSVSFANSSYHKNYTLTDTIGSYNVLLNNVNTFKAGSLSLGIGLKFTIK